MYSIAFIEPHLLCVGGIRRIIEVSNRLLKLGNAVAIFTPSGRPCKWLPNTVPVYPLSTLPSKSFNIVLFNLAEQYSHALKANAPIKVFWVLAAEALYKDPTIPLQAVRQNFQFLANSMFTANYIINSRRGIPTPQKIYVVNGGINPEHFHYDAAIKKDKQVLYYGSSRPWKGTKLIETATRTANVTTLKMEGLNTPQDKMYTLYNRAKIFVSAAQCEGFGFPQLEAMACGCPVICTADGGSADFVKPNVNAIVVPRTAEHIKHAVVKLLKDEKEQRRLAAAGLETAKEPKFNWDNISGSVNNLFNTWIS